MEVLSYLEDTLRDCSINSNTTSIQNADRIAFRLEVCADIFEDYVVNISHGACAQNQSFYNQCCEVQVVIGYLLVLWQTKLSNRYIQGPG